MSEGSFDNQSGDIQAARSVHRTDAPLCVAATLLHSPIDWPWKE
jgi:hypothetical protein